MQRVLVANRGEIAVRIIKAAASLGIESVAVVSEADVDSVAARLADKCELIGPPPAGASYLNQEAVLAAAKRSGADAIHPGYGFLSENAAFARAITEAGLIWVGPDPDSITLMGDKANALAAAISAGVPVVPGSGKVVDDEAELVSLCEKIGYPVALKAAAGGGGRGIRVVGSADELTEAWQAARREAQASFGSAAMYVEKFINPARHVEVQVFGDANGAVHLYERDCSLQRRHQKIIEETLAPGLPDEVRERMCQAAVALAEATNYRGAGTVEFLFDPVSNEFFFIEMNTRIQVEHPITEELLGVDLVAEQLRVAAGEPMYFKQDQLNPSGHVIELRINAEDPYTNFFPSPGDITRLMWPAGEGIRVDSGVEEGSTVPFFYDSMLAKLIVTGRDREQARQRALAALRDLRIEGIKTTAGFLITLLESPEFIRAAHHTRFVDENLKFLTET